MVTVFEVEVLPMIATRHKIVICGYKFNESVSGYNLLLVSAEHIHILAYSIMQ